MMLIDKINKSCEQIEVQKSYEKLVLQKRELESLKNKIDNLDKIVSSYIVMFNLITSNYENLMLEELKEKKIVLSKIDLIIKELKNNKYTDEKNTIYQINKIISENNAILKSTWNLEYKNQTSSILSMLDILFKLIDSSDKIKDIKNRIGKLNKWPFKEHELNSFKDAIEDAKKEISNLNIDDNLQNFLSKVSEGNASVMDLDNNILSWLKENHFDEKIKLLF